jgi:4-hydroxyphenylpyruvate dioxygenase
MTGTECETAQLRQEKALSWDRIDYIESYVGNAYQAAHFYRATFGFNIVAYAGLETGARDRVSFMIEQNDVRLLLTSALSPDSFINDHVRLHGDSVKDIAFAVHDVALAFNQAINNGAVSIMEPTTFEDESGVIIKATIRAVGDTVHSLIQRDGYDGAFLPNYSALPSPLPKTPSRFSIVDHIAISVEAGELDRWIDFYKQVLYMHQSHQEDIATEYSAMNSKVVQSSNGRIKFPMMEPAPGKRKSQIEEYLTFHKGPGVQHIALLCDDIVESVKTLRMNNIEFLSVPEAYYEMLESRLGTINRDIDTLRKENILVDRDGSGLLMQVFTKPIQGRPTLFFELIERQGARGFGGGNIKALFEAIEREQLRRGTM